jgi:hypothetical protein
LWSAYSKETTIEDRKAMTSWLLSTITIHPQMREFSSISDSQREVITENMAKLIENLLTKKCKKEAKLAFKYEGSVSLETSFQLLGRIAMAELFGDPNVKSAFENLNKYVDPKRLNSALRSTE